jgi:hypothetical protein
MARLRKLRSDFQVELALYAQAETSDANRLGNVRSLADTYVNEVDTLAASMGLHLAPEQVTKAEDLRLYFRVAGACIAARL